MKTCDELYKIGRKLNDFLKLNCANYKAEEVEVKLEDVRRFRGRTYYTYTVVLLDGNINMFGFSNIQFDNIEFLMTSYKYSKGKKIIKYTDISDLTEEEKRYYVRIIRNLLVDTCNLELTSFALTCFGDNIEFRRFCFEDLSFEHLDKTIKLAEDYDINFQLVPISIEYNKTRYSMAYNIFFEKDVCRNG